MNQTQSDNIFYEIAIDAYLFNRYKASSVLCNLKMLKFKLLKIQKDYQFKFEHVTLIKSN